MEKKKGKFCVDDFDQKLVSFRVSLNDWKALRRKAVALNTSSSELIRRLIKNFLNEGDEQDNEKP